MTQSHIQFSPLILERKTPAEEITEISATLLMEHSLHDVLKSLDSLKSRLEAPDAPKRWDGVFPWVGKALYGIIDTHFSRDLHTHWMEPRTFFVHPGDREEGNCNPANQSPYHDGVIITITAGSGDEEVRVIRWENGPLCVLFLCLGNHYVCIKAYDDSVYTVGNVVEGRGTLNPDYKPLPPGTVTRITISNHGATTEQRYSVEVVEPEKPKFAPITVANERVKVGVESQKIRMDYLTLGGSQIFSADEAREIRDALSAALEFGNPTQEQPATEAVAEGHPLAAPSPTTETGE